MTRLILIALGAAMLCLAALAVGLYVKHTEQGDNLAPERNVAASLPKILEENPYYLRADKRLQFSLNMQADRPKLAQIVAQLRDATGLDIAVADSLHDHDPDFGYVHASKHGYPVWQIMEMVAKKDLQSGYWEKTEGGYRLTRSLPSPDLAKAGSSSRTSPRFSRRLLLGYLLSALPFLAVGGIMLWLHRRRQAQQSAAASEPPAAPRSPSSG